MLKAFMNNHRIPFEEVEGANPDQKEMRNQLFDIAMKQGGSRDYPAVFVKRGDGAIEFIGHWDHVQDLLDADSIDEAIRKEHPEIVTFSSFFRA